MSSALFRADQGQDTELKRVVVAYETVSPWRRHSDAALSRYSGESGLGRGGAFEVLRLPAVEGEKVSPQVPGAFDRAMNAQREGNWALYEKKSGSWADNQEDAEMTGKENYTRCKDDPEGRAKNRKVEIISELRIPPIGRVKWPQGLSVQRVRERLTST